MIRRARGIQLAAAAAIALAGCGGAGSSSGAGGHLAQATAYLPGTPGSSYSFEFADWNAIERQLGIKPSQLRPARAAAPLYRIDQRTAVPGGNVPYDLAPPGKARLWSAPDVAWDATEIPTTSSPPLTMTGFQPSFDLSSVGRTLAGCGFTSKKVDGASLYSASLQAVAKCAGPFGDRIPTATNFALDAANHTVLMSGSPTVITAALSAKDANQAAPGLTSLLAQLNGDQAIAAGVGPGFCSRLSNPLLFVGRLATPAALARAEKLYPPARPYAALGFGITVTRSAARGHVVFAYPDANAARADLADREHRLRTGTSITGELPYSRLVRFLSGRTADSSVVLDVAAPAGRPLELGRMFDTQDLGLARCG